MKKWVQTSEQLPEKSGEYKVKRRRRGGRIEEDRLRFDENHGNGYWIANHSVCQAVVAWEEEDGEQADMGME